MSQWKFKKSEIPKKDMTPMWLRNVGLAVAGGSCLCAAAVSAMLYENKRKDMEEFSSLSTIASMKLTTMIDSEDAHRLAVWAASSSKTLRRFAGLHEPSVVRQQLDKNLTTEFCGMSMKNCLGLAAGFDKNAEAMLGMLDMGFGFVEIGSVTPEPQAGNPKPRVFRLPEQRAVINRYGFNSDGHDAVAKRFQKLKDEHNLFEPDRIIGINLGKNKTSEDAVHDYVQGVISLGPYADYLVVNVSSPNTPGLRDLQNEESLKELLSAVLKARNRLPIREPIDYSEELQKRKTSWVWGWQYQCGMSLEPQEPTPKTKRPALPPLLVKISPDVSKKGLASIAKVVQDVGVDGIIISNTTTRRDFGFEHPNLEQKGGLSGAPIKEMSTQVISDFYKLSGGTVPIIGVGGVETGEDAFAKIKAGASVVQLYSGLIYGGPPLVLKIKKELGNLLVVNGYSTVQEAIGADHRNT